MAGRAGRAGGQAGCEGGFGLAGGGRPAEGRELEAARRRSRRGGRGKRDGGCGRGGGGAAARGPAKGGSCRPKVERREVSPSSVCRLRCLESSRAGGRAGCCFLACSLLVSVSDPPPSLRRRSATPHLFGPPSPTGKRGSFACLISDLPTAGIALRRLRDALLRASEVRERVMRIVREGDRVGGDGRRPARQPYTGAALSGAREAFWPVVGAHLCETACRRALRWLGVARSSDCLRWGCIGSRGVCAQQSTRVRAVRTRERQAGRDDDGGAASAPAADARAPGRKAAPPVVTDARLATDGARPPARAQERLLGVRQRRARAVAGGASRERERVVQRAGRAGPDVDHRGGRRRVRCERPGWRRAHTGRAGRARATLSAEVSRRRRRSGALGRVRRRPTGRRTWRARGTRRGRR